MTNFTKSVLLDDNNFKTRVYSELIWTSADQMLQQRDLTGFPLKNIPLFQKITRTHFERLDRLAPEASNQLAVDSFLVLLDNLDSAGESSEDYILWCGNLYDGVFRSIDRQPARYCWIEQFYRWHHAGVLDTLFSMHGIDPSVFAELQVNTIEQVKKVEHEFRNEKKEWRSSPRNRSKWDNVLWLRYYEEVRTSPLEFFFFSYEQSKFARWWHNSKEHFSDLQIANLTEELTLAIAEAQRQDDLLTYTKIMPLNQAFYPENPLGNIF